MRQVKRANEVIQAGTSEQLFRRMRGAALLSCIVLVPALHAERRPRTEFIVNLTASEPSPATVGTRVTWTATVPDAGADTIWYRFRSGGFGPDLRVVKDFGPDNTLDWTVVDHEGIYWVEVTARNKRTGEVASAERGFYMRSNVTGDAAVVKPTSHPLVFLYSAPACPAGASMAVQFSAPDGSAQTTASKPCDGIFSMNFYLAGLRPGMEYSARHIITDGTTNVTGRIVSAALRLVSGDLPARITSASVITPASGALSQRVLLHATIGTKAIATDLDGNIIWYDPGNLTFITRPEPGGYFFGILQDRGADQSGQIVREFDLAGIPVRETNAARVSEQLVLQGKKPISGFHHEARMLSNGNMLVLASEEQMLTGVQGDGPVDVLGDAIIVLDRDLNVVWSWDAFDHLDPHRMATLLDTCQAGGCPPSFLAPVPNDWLHGNSVSETPDGNLLYSARSQDWVIKIDYRNGQGSGDVIWKLGKDGDFTIVSSDPNPWFSHQHDPQFEPGSNVIDLFDNGNTRISADSSQHSRGQSLQIDEVNRVATVLENADMGYYSFALGAAQKLADGNYHYDVGFLSDNTSISVEVDGSGTVVYAMRVAAPAYRTFRLQDLYAP